MFARTHRKRGRPGQSLYQLPSAQFWAQDGATTCPSSRPGWRRDVVLRTHTRLPRLLCHDDRVDRSLKLSCPPFPHSATLHLSVIRDHLLAIYCISVQNLYFRHFGPQILNLNSNVVGHPHYLISGYSSIIRPSTIQHAER